MSDSDDYEDCFDFSDAQQTVKLVTQRKSRRIRRKANTPSPKTVPRKKQREVLTDFNAGEGSSSDEDDNEDIGDGRTNSKIVRQTNKKRRRSEASSAGDSNFEEEEDDRISSTSSEMARRSPATGCYDKEGERIMQSGHISGTQGSSDSAVVLEDPSSEDDVFEDARTSESDDMEIRSPLPASISAILADKSRKDSSQQTKNRTEVQLRVRKRLSVSSTPGSRSSLSSSETESSMPSASEVQTIYDTCSQMFNSNRINPQNAFNLRLLDCINHMINSPGYDKSNMHLTASTVEIGTKIYVCRVDNTHTQVLSLASDVTLMQRRKNTNGAETVNSQEQNEGAAGDDEYAFDDEEAANRRQKQRRKAVKKRGRFVETNNAKLLTGLEEQNVKFVTRRNFLKKKFNQMIYDDLEFDYLGYFLEPEDEHPLQTEQENANIKKALKIPDCYTNPAEMNKLTFLPFSYLPKFDPEVYDVWGCPLNAVEEMTHQFSQEPQLPANDEFAYDPAGRPAEYPDEGPPGNSMNNSIGDVLLSFRSADDGDGKRHASPVDIWSLDHLDEYFQTARNLLKISKSKYGLWGPNFNPLKNAWPSQRRPRAARKIPERFDFTNIDFNRTANKFDASQTAAGKTIFDDIVIQRWIKNKITIPYLGVEVTSYDDDFHPLDFENEDDPKFVPNIFRLFTCKTRSVLDPLNICKKTMSSLLHSYCGQGDDFDFNDIEQPRDGDAFFQDINQDGYHPFDGATLADAEWQFPSSIPGLLNEDPFTIVSGVESIRFSRKPKPIDMKQLKKAILTTLMTSLHLDTDNGVPLVEEHTKIDLAQLMLHVLKMLDQRTEKLLSVPIFIVALMHVVADKRLFVLYDDTDPNCPAVVCKGSKFNHAEHIPMPDYE